MDTKQNTHDHDHNHDHGHDHAHDADEKKGVCLACTGEKQAKHTCGC